MFDDLTDAVRQYRHALDAAEGAHHVLADANAQMRDVEQWLRSRGRRELVLALAMERATLHAGPREHDARRARVDDLLAEPEVYGPSEFGFHPGAPPARQ